MSKRVLLPPIYLENRRVQFWFVEYERESGVAPICSTSKALYRLAHSACAAFLPSTGHPLLTR